MRRFARSLGKTFNLMSNSVNEPPSLFDNLSKFKEMIQPRQIQPEIESSNDENMYSLLIYTGFVVNKSDLYNNYFVFFSMFIDDSTSEQLQNAYLRLDNYENIRQFIHSNSQDNIRYDTNYLNPRRRRQINQRINILNIDLLLAIFDELNFNNFAFFVEVQQTIYFTVETHKGYTTITYLINIMDSNFESFMRTPNIKYYSNISSSYVDEFNISCILMIKKEDLDYNEDLENYLKTEYSASLSSSGITPRIFHVNINDIINLQIQCEIYTMLNRIQYRLLKLFIFDGNNYPRNTHITRLEESTINKIREYIRRQPSRIEIRGGEFQTKK